MKTDPLATYAAWPATAEAATADALIRYAAVRAQGAHALAEAGLDVSRQIVRFTQYLAIAQLLRNLQTASTWWADEAARRLWTLLADGSDGGDVVRFWLRQAGVDPDAVAKAAVDAYRARAEQVAAETARDAEGQAGAR